MPPVPRLKDSMLYVHMCEYLAANPSWTVRMYCVYEDLSDDLTNRLTALYEDEHRTLLAPRVWSKLDKGTPTNAVYVGRPSPYGNPFTHLPSTRAQFKVRSRTEAIERFREWVHAPEQTDLRARAIIALRGRHLVCWCAPRPCHADIWLDLVNRPMS